MELTAEEQAMLNGEPGGPVKRAIELQIEVGKFYSAKRFVPVTNVHMMGDIEVMGDGGLEHLRCFAEQHARCVVNTTTNARCFDFAHVDALKQDKREAEKELQLIGYLKRMNVMTTDTCINYQTLYQPHLGEHVAWGDTGTVIWANSVCGARSNFESGPAAMAAAMTERVPEYGFHLDQYRKATFVVEVEAELNDLAEWGALAKVVGESHQSYFAVPVFTGMRQDYPALPCNRLPHNGLRGIALLDVARARPFQSKHALGRYQSNRLRKQDTVCHHRWAFSRCSTRPINSPAGMFSASARLKIVARARPFSARSRALIWLRSVPARSASWSCVSACCKRSSCNTSPKIVVRNLLSRISRQGLAIHSDLSAYGCMRYPVRISNARNALTRRENV